MIDKWLDFVWPRKCEVCGGPANRLGRYLCSDCLNRLQLCPVEGCCRYCGRAAEGFSGEYVCEECRAKRPHFDRVGSVFPFTGEARQLINNYKFHTQLWLRNDLVDFMEGHVRARFKVDEIELVIPMPSTLAHRIDRGFNQCEVLGRELAKRLEKPFSKRAMKRVGNPARQSSLEEAERITNVQGTFAVIRPSEITNKTILVVEDIMTTGSTLSECAKELKASGAKRVWGITLGRSAR